MTCSVTYQDRFFFCRVSFEKRLIPKKAGFRWDPEQKLWYTPEPGVALRLREYADEKAKTYLNELFIHVSPWSGALPDPPEGLAYMPHQLEAAKFSLERNRSYLGLDPGLGKTIVATLILRALKSQAVYICPPFLAGTVSDEFQKWIPWIEISQFPQAPVGDLYILPDSFLISQECHLLVREFKRRNPKSILFIDEAHRYKNPDAKRTQALLGKKNKKGLNQYFQKQIFMSGTPMPNRPVELYTILSRAAPETIDFQNLFDYGVKYCAGYQSAFGWDFTGASNLPELASRVVFPQGPFMLRQKKELLKLPPKLEEVFTFSHHMSPELSHLDSSTRERYQEEEDFIRLAIQDAEGDSDLHLSRYRRYLGLEKVKAACEYIESILKDTDESILVFAYHKEVILELEKRLTDHHPLVVTGSTPNEIRQRRVKTFQETDLFRIFLANYLAAGIGFTLTKATRVLFVEFSWTPGDNAQASDRAHRIGQTESVLVQYMCFQNSIDKAVIETLLRKRKAIQYV